jgi:hypothetical protein
MSFRVFAQAMRRTKLRPLCGNPVFHAARPAAAQLPQEHPPLKLIWFNGIRRFPQIHSPYYLINRSLSLSLDR